MGSNQKKYNLFYDEKNYKIESYKIILTIYKVIEYIMARYYGPRRKIVRRLGTVLPGLVTLKKDLKDLLRKNPPGQHGENRRLKLSDYALRLREKQKLRYNYGLSEKQMKKYLAMAYKTKKNPSTELFSIIERRLDNLVYRIGFACSIKSARQIIVHGHIMVNGSKLDKPSALLKIGDIIISKKTEKVQKLIAKSLNIPGRNMNPSYIEKLKVDDLFYGFKLKFSPKENDILIDIKRQMIVEYYSGR